MSLIQSLLDVILNGPSPEDRTARARLEWVQASSAKPISEEMTRLLCLVIFDGYALFPHERERSQSRR